MMGYTNPASTDEQRRRRQQQQQQTRRRSCCATILQPKSHLFTIALACLASLALVVTASSTDEGLQQQQHEENDAATPLEWTGDIVSFQPPKQPTMITDTNQHSLRSSPHHRSLTATSPAEGEIPHNLFFSYAENILETKRPRSLHENVKRSISIYREALPDLNAYFLDDVSCAKEIHLAEPKLTQHFIDEHAGAFKSDICRTALLYLYGGYYMDNDLDIVEPYIAEEGITFVSTMSCSGDCLFNAFIGATPQHPILKHALQLLLDVYEFEMEKIMIGPKTLGRAYASLPENMRGNVHILEEIELRDDIEDYPDLDRQDGWGRCQWAIHDPVEYKVYFWARIVGAGGCFIHKNKIKAVKHRLSHRLWFTSEKNPMQYNKRSPLYQNVKNTIDKYRTEWYENLAPLNFITDDKCAKYVKDASPKLKDYYVAEERGYVRGDICQIACMYLFGGYYHDIDLQVVDIYKPPPKKEPSFVTVSSCDGHCLSTSFMVSVAKHPILKTALSLIVEAYETGTASSPLMAPVALKQGLDSLDERERGDVQVLEHIQLKDGLYPELSRQVGVGTNCNWVIHNPSEERVYFFSEFVGAGTFNPLHENDSIGCMPYQDSDSVDW